MSKQFLQQIRRLYGSFDVKCERKSRKPRVLRQRLAIKWGLRTMSV